MRADALLCLVFVVACREEERKYPETRIATDAGEIVIRLLDPGAEPRKILRYDLKDWEGEKVVRVIDVLQRVWIDPNVEPIAMDPPPQRMVVAYSPATTTKDGNYRTEISFEPHGDTPSGLEDMKGWMVLTPHGCVVAIGLEFPGMTPAHREMLDRVGQTLRHASMPFPDQPVGRGARWELIVPLDFMGLQLDSRMAYRLDALTSDGGTASFDVDMKGSGDLKLPGEEPVPVALVRADGTGTFEFRFRSFVPKLTSDVTMSAKMDGLDVEITTSTKMSPAD